MKHTMIIALLSFVCGSLFSQTALSGEIRPRGEFRYGYKSLPDSTSEFAAFVSQRTRLILEHSGNKFSTCISLQDVRVWGDQKTNVDLPGTYLNQAWVELFITDSLSLKAGRQKISYSDERLLSQTNWNQNGSSHDLLLLKLKYKGWAADFGAGFNQNQENLFGTSYKGVDLFKTLNFLWITRKFGQYEIHLAGIADGYQKENYINTLYMRGTSGAELYYSKEKISAQLRGFYQTGKTKTGSDISAWFAGGYIGYSPVKAFSMQAGGEIFSGNDATDTSNRVHHAFSTLYNSNHRFLGSIDYFGNPETSTKGAGLTDVFLKLKYKAGKKNTVKTEFHYFALQNNYVFKGATIDPFLAYEADLEFSRKINENVTVEAGYSIMLPSESMEVLKGGDKDEIPQWFYVMLTIKPEFL
ncbi:MAG: alginate export family protein [Bacteroidetes bacterium]|nr:alginate export family protein [Bacteroidota bacterium]MBU1717877.1 alginate export family protein [Bacteroidota bacterium]